MRWSLLPHDDPHEISRAVLHRGCEARRKGLNVRVGGAQVRSGEFSSVVAGRDRLRGVTATIGAAASIGKNGFAKIAPDAPIRVRLRQRVLPINNARSAELPKTKAHRVADASPRATAVPNLPSSVAPSVRGHPFALDILDTYPRKPGTAWPRFQANLVSA